MNPKQILMIDDEIDIQTIARMGLNLISGWQVLTASSGQEGIQQAKGHQPDAILLDVMMPDMDGVATLAALKADAVTQAIPVIFLTAKSKASDRQKLYALGAQGVINKPFDPTTLASQISGFLGWPN
ncbi:MAG: two-component system response regulator [Phormidesmis priestleyi]|uniref:Two-component system response regulator n=1 Tax=Phormidesmis priestleyi TaxID=268141 RepID=A0A2W4XC82_9CYAN|nr:MAG: two-component system response regulator [Phormidesmis priestleyi]